jgi:hypothetical protein
MKADAPRVPKLRIPAWVPKQVAAKARELSRNGMALSDRSLLVASEADFQRLLRALTTKPRMKWVWRELGKRQGDGYLHPARSLRKPVADPQGRAMTVLFFHALKIACEVSLDRVSVASRKEVAEVPEQCANMARTLHDMAEALLEPTPDQLNREDARKLEDAAEVLDRMAQDYAAGDHRERDHGNALTRHVTGELVKACRIIFRRSMYRTVGTIAGVLLGVSNIPASTMRNWHPDPRK